MAEQISETQQSIEQEYAPLFDYVKRYAEKKAFGRTLRALQLIGDILVENYGALVRTGNDAGIHLASFHHSLSVCRMLIDLPIFLDADEKDILLASAICHVLPESFSFESLQIEMLQIRNMDPAVFDMISLLFQSNNLSGFDKSYFDRIQQNKTAVLIKLADQGHLMELIYDFPSWTARTFIYETRNNFLSICVYAKLHYPDVIAPISILMEKIRSLAEVAEILLNKYESRETELTQEILALQEDNAALKHRIRVLQNNTIYE